MVSKCFGCFQIQNVLSCLYDAENIRLAFDAPPLGPIQSSVCIDGRTRFRGKVNVSRPLYDGTADPARSVFQFTGVDVLDSSDAMPEVGYWSLHKEVELPALIHI